MSSEIDWAHNHQSSFGTGSSQSRLGLDLHWPLPWLDASKTMLLIVFMTSLFVLFYHTVFSVSGDCLISFTQSRCAITRDA